MKKALSLITFNFSGRLISSRDSLNGVNRKLNNEKTQLQEDKRKLTSQLSQSDNALKSAKNQITSLQTEKNKLTQENTQLRNRKLEPEKYKVYAKHGSKAYCYYNINDIIKVWKVA